MEVCLLCNVLNPEPNHLTVASVRKIAVGGLLKNPCCAIAFDPRHVTFCLLSLFNMLLMGSIYYFFKRAIPIL